MEAYLYMQQAFCIWEATLPVLPYSQKNPFLSAVLTSLSDWWGQVSWVGRLAWGLDFSCLDHCIQQPGRSPLTPG